MSIRKISSLTAFLAFFVMVVTSIILYIVPQGRVAYWADWHLFGLSKEQWGEIHINTGFLFLLSLILHIYYNWKPIVSYLKDKAKQLKILTKEFNIALIITLLVTVGTYFEIPPFSTVIGIGNDFKESAAKKYGEPPYGHAELSSLKIFTKKMNLDLQAAILNLKDAGYKFDNDAQSLKEIAKNNGVSPQQIYQTISKTDEKTPASAKEQNKLPESPTPGTGNLTLVEFCSQYNIDVELIIRLLAKSNIQAQQDMTIKEIGKNNQLSPIDVYEQIKTVTAGSPKN